MQMHYCWSRDTQIQTILVVAIYNVWQFHVPDKENREYCYFLTLKSRVQHCSAASASGKLSTYPTTIPSIRKECVWGMSNHKQVYLIRMNYTVGGQIAAWFAAHSWIASVFATLKSIEPWKSRERKNLSRFPVIAT